MCKPSISNYLEVLFLRYFADGKGIGSEFEAYFTTLRKIGSLEEFEKCPEEEYDCDDATCISKELGKKLSQKIFNQSLRLNFKN